MQVGWVKGSRDMEGEARRITRWWVVLQVWMLYSFLYHTRVRMAWAYAYSDLIDRLDW